MTTPNDNSSKVIYEMLWRNKWICSDCKTIEEMIDVFKNQVDYFTELRDAGVVVDPDCVSSIPDDYTYLITTDVDVANKYGFYERETFDDDDDGCTFCDGSGSCEQQEHDEKQ